MSEAQLQNIISQIGEGVPPSNVQIQTELAGATEFLKEKEAVATTYKEQQTLQDAQKLAEAAGTAIREKNPDERIQQFIKDVTRVAEKGSTVAIPVISAWDDIKNFLNAVRDLTITLFQSPNFRNSLLTLMSTLKDVFIYQEEKLEATTDTTSSRSVASELEKRDVMEEVKESVDAIPVEKRHRIRTQLRDLIREMKDKPESKRAFNQFFRVWGMLRGSLYTQLEKVNEDRDVEKVQVEAKQIIESFTGDRKLDTFLSELHRAVDRVDKDEEFRSLLHDSKEFFNELLDKPELLDSDEHMNRVDELMDRSRILAKKYNYDPSLNKAVDEALLLLEEMKKDQTVSELQNLTTKLVENFVFTDSKGNVHVDYDLAGQMRKHVVPFLVERVKEIPIPRVEVSDPDYERLYFDDLSVQIDELLPEMIKIHSENDIDFSVSDLTPTTNVTHVKFLIQGIKPKLRNFYFNFKRRAILSMEDEGRADLIVKGSGMSILMTFTLRSDVTTNRLILGDHTVDVHIDSLDLDVKEARHRYNSSTRRGCGCSGDDGGSGNIEV
eukprot:TRINITY_DN5554_c0_g2_i2.p1 TRINITY_DN5554_c0_g2~~TRINITY_DN5554_c0_g2_i2.p1  ORF type:complete len:552 (+),score=132.73 TRINITY_DN5554_c0_g2_i2:184-1839(+)